MTTTAQPLTDAPQVSDSLISLLGYQIRRASNVMMASLTAELSKLGLTVLEGSVLTVIEGNPGLSQSELGRLLGVKRANMAPIAAKLNELGLIRATPSGRSNLLRVSAKGGRRARAVRLAMERNDERYFDGLSDEDKAKVVKVLQAVWQG